MCSDHVHFAGTVTCSAGDHVRRSRPIYSRDRNCPVQYVINVHAYINHSPVDQEFRTPGYKSSVHQYLYYLQVNIGIHKQ